jgi:hypothetical protein
MFVLKDKKLNQNNYHYAEILDASEIPEFDEKDASRTGHLVEKVTVQGYVLAVLEFSKLEEFPQQTWGY